MAKYSRASTSRLAEKYIVRFPDGMRARIIEAAKTNNRTINAEIIARLEASFQPLDTTEMFRAILDNLNQQKAAVDALRQEHEDRMALFNLIKKPQEPET